jgi:ureidoglycolate lyase
LFGQRTPPVEEVNSMKLEPLTSQAFAPFGEVVQAEGVAPVVTNQGYADRFNHLAEVVLTDGAAHVSLSHPKPRPRPISIDLMERHPLGSQLFMPLQDEDWLVVVCEDPLNAQTFRAFRASGKQGVNYAPDIWHFPLLVLGQGQRFIVLDRKGPGHNLEEIWLEKPLTLAL